MNYKRRSWNGVLPANFLAQWASEKEVSCNTADFAAECFPCNEQTLQTCVHDAMRQDSVLSAKSVVKPVLAISSVIS